MRFTIVNVALILMVAAAVGGAQDLDTVRVGDVAVTLGMSKAQLVNSLPESHSLVMAKDRVPKEFTSVEVHDAKATIVRRGTREERIVGVIFENGRVAQITRLISELRGGGPQDAMSFLIKSMKAVFPSEETPLTVSTGTYGSGEITFEYFEARAENKRVVVTSSPGLLQAVEIAGREDIPVAPLVN